MNSAETRTGQEVGGDRHRSRTLARTSRAGCAFDTPEAAAEAVRRQVELQLKSVAALVGCWAYNEQMGGTEVFRVLRFDLAEGGKTFRPIHLSERGWSAGDPPRLLPLYRVGELPALGAVYLVEGEKATEAARSIGLPATTSAHGSSGAAKTDWTPLRGRDVHILRTTMNLAGSTPDRRA